MQIKTTMRYHHHTPEKLLSKTQQITSVAKDTEKREPSHTSYKKQTFKSKSVIRDREGHYIMIKRLTHQEDKTFINIYVPNIRALNV